MERATISELKNRLSAYLDKVRAGGTVLIFDRDQPIARIERVDAGVRPDDRIARLERAGLLRRASQPPLTLQSLPRPAPKAKRSVVAALIEERREGR
jgi:antitoxin (DNA-binding transcriptional repressor) of toxin-antitoxin stability system